MRNLIYLVLLLALTGTASAEDWPMFRHDIERSAVSSEEIKLPLNPAWTHVPDAPPARMARTGMRELYGEEPILIRTMGGSIPIAPIIEALGVPAAIVPTVNMDNNQHSPNENLRLGNLLEGIVILMSVLQQAP